jgi:MotA/TolQ/ExbB proton channel family
MFLRRALADRLAGGHPKGFREWKTTGRETAGGEGKALARAGKIPAHYEHISLDWSLPLCLTGGCWPVSRRSPKNAVLAGNGGDMSTISRADLALSGPDAPERGPLLLWMIFTGLSIFAGVLLWRYGFIRLMLVSDRTYISSLIAVLYVATCGHCFWRTRAIAREAEAGRRCRAILSAPEGARALSADARALPAGLVTDHIRSLVTKAEAQAAGRIDQTLLLRSLADRLRGSNAFGAFVSDTLMKLGLLGTIIGFIIMLAPIAGLDAADKVAMKSSMGLMSDGMAVAMYTTLAGLVGSILVRIQYYMLDAATQRVFSDAVMLTETRVTPVLEGHHDG